MFGFVGKNTLIQQQQGASASQGPVPGKNTLTQSLPPAQGELSKEVSDLAHQVELLTRLSTTLLADPTSTAAAVQAITVRTQVQTLSGQIRVMLESNVGADPNTAATAQSLLQTADVLLIQTEKPVENALGASQAPAKKPLETGIPLVDKGPLCEQPNHPAGLDCSLGHEKRQDLLLVLSQASSSAMDNWRAAIKNAQLDLVVEKFEKDGWPLLVDIAMEAFLGPAAGIIGKALTRFLKETAEEEDLVKGVEMGMKWLHETLKGQAEKIPRGIDGKLAFLKMLEAQVKPFGQYIIQNLPTQIDDAGIAAVTQYWSNVEIHSPENYGKRIEALLSRFSTQVGSIGENQRDTRGYDNVMRTASVVLIHKGKRRLALVSQTRQLSEEAYPSSQRSIATAQSSFPPDMGKLEYQWRFEQWVDSDMAAMSQAATKERFDGDIPPIDVDAEDSPINKDGPLHYAIEKWDGGTGLFGDRE